MAELKRTDHRVGLFDGYQVLGTRYESDANETGWFIIAYKISGIRVQHYWVSNDEFFTVGLHIFYNNTDRSLIQPLGVAKDIEPAERQAILKAIAEWEK